MEDAVAVREKLTELVKQFSVCETEMEGEVIIGK